MSKTISIISCKGGVGKTTSGVNISSYIQTQGRRVLAVDMDYQHNLSKHFGILPGHLKNSITLYDLFVAAMDDCSEEELDKLVHSAVRKSTTVDIIPATAKLSLLDKLLPTATCREFVLREILKCIKNEYDYIFIDCHPGCDLFAINALTVSDSVIIPVEAHPLGLEGLDQVEKLIATVRRHLNRDLKVDGNLILGPTNDNGYAVRDQLNFGTYTVTETKFPDGYYAGNYKTSWTVTLNEKTPDATVTINAVNEQIPGSCKIVKTSEDGRIDGVSFKIEGNGINKTVTTKDGGQIEIDNLKPGIYTVTEITEDKYEPQETRRVTVVSGQTSTVTFNNTLKRGNLTVTKTSEDGLNAGIKFHLYGVSLSGLEVDEYAVTDESGKAYFNDVLIPLLKISGEYRFAVKRNGKYHFYGGN